MNLQMRKKSLMITSLMLLISIGSLTRVTAHSQIRAVDFVSIMSAGILAGVVLVQVILLFRKE
jgi:hypothetical protein